MRRTLPLVLLAVLLAGCAAAAPNPAAGTRPAITDPSRPIEVQAGETFQIVIDANPSTGYHWGLTGELDGKLVELLSRDYTEDEPVMPGSGGVDVWTFKAVSAGQAQITLGSYPPSNDPVDPEQTVTFDVTVK
jgi:inhibitor of cysteine peptidase